jgi:hypothetical protein
MSVREVQQLLARLYTEPKLLEEYLADPDGFSLKCSTGEAEFLRRIDRAQLEFFAISLRSKRAGEVKKLLPMTVQALGDKFDEEFDRYASTAIPTGERKHLADSMAFCDHLIAREAFLNRFMVEAASFELLDYRVRFHLKREGEAPVVVQVDLARRPWFRLNRFVCRLSALSDNDDTNEGKGARARLVLFARLPGLRGVWYW